MRIESLHWSVLRQIQRSPAHLKYAHESGYASSRSQNAGTLIHAVALGGEFQIYDGERRGKAWEAFRDSHAPGAWIVTAKEYERAQRCVDVLRKHQLAWSLLMGRQEDKWTATMFGRPCAGTIDVYNPETGWLGELKTARTVEPERFRRAIAWYAYHAQLAWYRDSLLARGLPFERAGVVGLETEPPYAVTVAFMTPRALDMGQRLNRLWAERLQACEESDDWPSYTQEPITFDVEEQEPELIFGDDDESEAAA